MFNLNTPAVDLVLIIKTKSRMKTRKAFLVLVTLASGVVIPCSGIGYDKDEAMMDACSYLASTNYPQDSIEDVDIIEQEDRA